MRCPYCLNGNKKFNLNSDFCSKCWQCDSCQLLGCDSDYKNEDNHISDYGWNKPTSSKQVAFPDNYKFTANHKVVLTPVYKGVHDEQLKYMNTAMYDNKQVRYTGNHTNIRTYGLAGKIYINNKPNQEFMCLQNGNLAFSKAEFNLEYYIRNGTLLSDGAFIFNWNKPIDANKVSIFVSYVYKTMPKQAKKDVDKIN